MRIISIFLAIVLSAFLVAGCGATKNNMTETPAASALPGSSVSAELPPSVTPSAAVTASPEADKELKSIVEDFIAAQNSQDWDAFVDLWADSEQVFYKDFFAYPDNAEKHNGYFSIKSAELSGVFDISQPFKDDTEYLQYAFCDDAYRDYILAQGDYSVVAMKANYSLESEFWDYREGLNYRVLILVPENGQWKVLQDYGYPGAAVYFGDTLPPEETGNDTEEPDNLVDGTVHFTKSITGYYIGSQIGDYFHPGFKTIDGEEHWFWTASDVANYESFHRYQKAEITYENRDKYIAEADRVINIDRITGIKLLD
jgi:hypothetical protein